MADRVVSYSFRGDFTSLTAGLAAAGKGVGDLGTKLTALDKNGARMRAGLTTLGGAAGKFGLVAAAGLGAAVVASANFDQAMSKVQAATGESAAAMETLRAAALKAGADTAFSASEAAAGIENLAKAGVSTQDILGGGLSGALDLAAAGELDVASAAEIAATAMTQFKLSGADVPHIADLLAAGAGKAQGEVSDLGAALNQSGLVAGQMGLSIEETTGALSAFASAGLLGSDAGTSLKTMLLRLANPSAKAAQTMQELGINAYDAQGNLVPMADLAGQLEGAFEGMSQKQRDAALATIFGSDAIRAANVLYSEGADGITDWTNKVNDSGFAAEQAATKMDNLKGDLEQLRGSLETALIGTGDGAQTPLRSLVQNLTAVVNAFNNLPPAAKNAIASLTGVTAILGGGLWFTSKVVSGIADTKLALDQLGVTSRITAGGLTRMARTTGGIMALGAAVTILGNELAEASGSKLNTEDLQRDLEALAGGRNREMLNLFTDDLFTLGQTSGKVVEPLKELVTGFGLFGNTPMDNSRENIEAIDQALASMVESGDSAQASAIFSQLEAAAADAGISTDDLTKSLDAYNQALVNAGEGAAVIADGWIVQGNLVESNGLATLKTAAATNRLAGAQSQAAGAGEEFAAHLEAQQKALNASRKAARETAESFIDFSANADKAKVSLGDWIKQLEDQADALLNFQRNAATAAEKGLSEGLIAELEKLGPAGALRMRQFANASQKEIDRANAAFARSQRVVNNFADTIAGVPAFNLQIQDAEGRKRIREVQRLVDKFGMTKAEAKAFIRDAATDKIQAIQRLMSQYDISKAEATALLNDMASGKLAKVRKELRDLDGDEATAYMNVITRYPNGVPGGRMPAGADGMTVPGPRHPYGDKVLAYLAPGEEVITNRHGEADQFRRDRAAGRIPAYADGGTAGGWSAGMGYFSGDAGLGMVARASAAAADAQYESARAANENADAHDEARQSHRKELAERKKLLEQELEREKERRDMLRQERDALKSAVSDIITGGDLFTVNGPVDTSGMSEDLQAIYAANPELQGGAVTSNVGSMLAEGQERLALIRKLKRMGLNGAALAYISTQPIEVLRELASGSKGTVRQWEQQFTQLQNLGATAGGFVGNAVYGKEIRETNSHLVDVKQELREIRKELERTRGENKKNSDSNAEKSGKAAGRALSGAVGAGVRGRL